MTRAKEVKATQTREEEELGKSLYREKHDKCFVCGRREDSKGIHKR